METATQCFGLFGDTRRRVGTPIFVVLVPQKCCGTIGGVGSRTTRGDSPRATYLVVAILNISGWYRGRL